MNGRPWLANIVRALASGVVYLCLLVAALRAEAWMLDLTAGSIEARGQSMFLVGLCAGLVAGAVFWLRERLRARRLAGHARLDRADQDRIRQMVRSEGARPAVEATDAFEGPTVPAAAVLETIDEIRREVVFDRSEDEGYREGALVVLAELADAFDPDSWGTDHIAWPGEEPA
jgi:hypothetical protein